MGFLLIIPIVFVLLRSDGGSLAFVEFENHDSAAKAFKAPDKKPISNKNIELG